MTRRTILIVLPLSALLVVGCFGDHKVHPTKKTDHGAHAPRLESLLLPTKPTRYSVTRFGCPNRQKTTIDMEACLGLEGLRLNRRVNALIKVIWSQLDCATGRRYFAKGEQAWLAYIGNECTSSSRSWPWPAYPHLYEGGSSAPVNFGICENRLTRSHIRELTQLALETAPH